MAKPAPPKSALVAVLELAAEGDVSLRQAARQRGVAWRTLMDHCRENPDLNKLRNNAVKDNALARTIDAVDRCVAATDREEALAAKVGFDATKWALSRVDPDYQERQQHQHVGSEGGPIETAATVTITIGGS